MRFSRKVSVFHGRQAPEAGLLVGSGAVIEALELTVPIPDKLSLISEKHRQYEKDNWLVYTPRYEPSDTLSGHLVFSLKYEGINLLFFKKLFQKIAKSYIEEIIKKEPLGQYSRRIWFLYEWLLEDKLQVADIKAGNYVPLVDTRLQYALSKGENSKRHRVRNNLPGTVDFCPMIKKTEKLNQYINEDLSKRTEGIVQGVSKDIILRTSAFLLLKDSKASFNIEGETPSSNRANRWGKIIGQAGMSQLSIDEFLRLQQLVIENQKFTRMGIRVEGGFVGEHDRNTGEPIPDHISAKWQDLKKLLEGLIATNNLLEKSMFYPVLVSAKIAFGFVFIHPFSDGNGRIHRYIIHHILSKLKYTPQGIIFPVSAAILERIDDYRSVLEGYSLPILEFIEWVKTSDNNVKVLNNTIDYYRYFDATSHAEFLYDCINDTIEEIIPQEIKYLNNYDNFKSWLDDKFEMPDKLVALLVRFLKQNNGKLSKRARSNEFSSLKVEEIMQIETQYAKSFDIDEDI